MHLLWAEYVAVHGDSAYRYSQYCHHYRQWRKKQRRSMRQVHRAGENTFIDYCGPTMPVACRHTGDIRQAQIFVAVLGASSYTFAEGVVHLNKNAKKEGAIREVLERMEAGHRLPEYTIVLDADSFMVPTDASSVEVLVENAIEHMATDEISGMAFRINAIIPSNSSLLGRCIYADYAGGQFDNWLTSKSNQLWVINGPGGIFRSDDLLGALRTMVPDFETGDLLITVRLMQSDKKVAFWPHIDIQTWVPDTYIEYFRQRRRWESAVGISGLSGTECGSMPSYGLV